jgi:hypothetical protein
VAAPARKILRPAYSVDPFDAKPLKQFLELVEIRERRRAEAAAALLAEHEAKHGEITEEELRQFEAKWIT